ncbi:hypothetical protein EYF80_018362 [Liparis tanakae]|uniref:Uncharacterized protein n=1 Tax=Liparis tanakae TaxID=230148 RepID=A0A4Z2I2E5_9TELE|nr:hypothetical protein EYF80_018362 [Liparis tanakae]
MNCRRRCKREIFKFAQYLYRLVTGTLNTELNKLRLKDTTTSPLTAAWSVGVTAKIKPRCISPPSTPHTHVIIGHSLRLRLSRMAMQNIELHLHHSADSSTFRPITYLANSINGEQNLKYVFPQQVATEEREPVTGIVSGLVSLWQVVGVVVGVVVGLEVGGRSTGNLKGSTLETLTYEVPSPSLLSRPLIVNNMLGVTRRDTCCGFPAPTRRLALMRGT